MDWFWSFPLLARRALVVAFIVVALPLGAVIVLRRPRVRGGRYLGRLAIGGVIGLTVLSLTGWLLGNVVHVFGDVMLTQRVIGWGGCAGGFAGVAIAASLTRRSPRARWWHHGITALAVVGALLLGALGINREYGFFVNPKSVATFGSATVYPAFVDPAYAHVQSVNLSTGWKPPAGMPTTGILNRVTIPAHLSGFKARQAMVYLPPAAQVKQPPRLPVIVALSGQPGTPIDMLTSGGLLAVAEAYQAAHQGLAPIIVAPDQLGRSDINPMCADSSLGLTETYLVQDVMKWVHSALPTQSDAAHTALIGFSQGGTCVVQLGFGHPGVFGNLVPIAPEKVATMGDKSVRVAFHGDTNAYQAIQPLTRLAAHGPYRDLYAHFYVGSTDPVYQPAADELAAAATAQKVHATVIRSPGSAHDYHTVQFAVKDSFPRLIARFGLPA